MKKFLAVSLMLVLLGGFLAAQEVGITAELTGKFNLIDYDDLAGGDDGDRVEKMAAGTLAPDAIITFKGDDGGTAGFTVAFDLDKIIPLIYSDPPAAVDPDDFQNDQAGLMMAMAKRQLSMGWYADLGDSEASVWFKPLSSDLITVKAGFKAGDSTIRYGNISSGDAIDDTGKVIVEDYISGFGGNPFSFILTSKPIEPLFIGLGYRNQLYADNDMHFAAIGDYLMGIQLAVGYEIGGIGAARVQYVGPYALSYDAAATNPKSDLFYLGNLFATDKFNTIELGFKVTALEGMGLVLDVVGKIPLGFKLEAGDTTTYNDSIKFGVIANFATGPISVNGGVGLALPYTSVDGPGDADTKVEGIGIKFHAEPAFQINDALAVGADLGLELRQHGKDLDAPMDLGLGAFVKYTVGKGTLKAGLAAKIVDMNKPDEAKSHTTFKLPITLNVAF